MKERWKVSPDTANKEIRYLKATFNFGLKEGHVLANPAKGIEFFPVEKKLRYIPSSENLDRVFRIADPDTQDYLFTIRETLARVGEINRLKWEDVNFLDRSVTLYTRKKKGGHLTPRMVPMTKRLFDLLKRRHSERDPEKPWVFWHRYWSPKSGSFQEGPYGDRQKIMRTLCRKAGVRYFRYHPIRHAGASLMDNHNVPLGAIQRILGHESRTTTEIYLHSIAESEREAMAVFEQANGKSHTKSHTDEVAGEGEEGA